MKWRRSTTPTGVPVYTSDEAPGFAIEGDVRFSAYSGMVFGQYVNEAGREARVVGWRVIRDDRLVSSALRTLAEAKRVVERRVGSPV